MKELATVIEGMKRKDKKSFKLMVNHYASRLMTVAMFYAKNKQDAEDILQDSFIRIFLHINSFDGNEESAFYAWSKTIVVNTALAKYRRKYYSHEKYLDRFEEAVDKSEIAQSHDYAEIISKIYGLPQKYREVVGLYALEGYSHAEIAEILHIQESTSRSIYSRAKSKLRNILQMTKTLIC